MPRLVVNQKVFDFDKFLWCGCETEYDEYVLSIRLDSPSGETLKHIISYHKCSKCNGLVKIEES